MMFLAEEGRAYYPDIARAGGLDAALSTALTDLGSPLQVSATSDGTPDTSSAFARREGRSANVTLATNERLFVLSFSRRSVFCAKGKTADLTDVARVFDRWIVGAGSIDELESFPFLTLAHDARAYDEGREVEYRWDHYLAIMPDRQPQLVEFVKEAARTPELRQLFPVLSHDFLGFSRCTSYPFTRGEPYVRGHSDGTYAVYAPDARPPDGAIGHGDARAAVRLVVDNLPPGCGPAVPGTADDLVS